MDNQMLQIVLWVGAAVVGFLYLQRRGKRKSMR